MSDQKLNVQLVQEVEKHPVLYDFTLPGYSRRDEVEKAWNQVASKLNMKAEECKDKWKNLRTVFARKLKQPASGSGGNKKQYYLMDVMQFSLPFIKTSKPPSAGNLPDPEKVKNSTSTSNSTVQEENPDEPEEENNITRTVPNPPNPTCSPSALEKPGTANALPAEQNSWKLKRKMNPKQKAEFDADKSIAEYFTAKKSTMNTLSNKEVVTDKKEESIKMFLLSLLPDLTKLSDSQVRAFKRKVLTIIDDFEEQQEQLSSDFGSSVSGGITQYNVMHYSPCSTPTSSQAIGASPAIENTAAGFLSNYLSSIPAEYQSEEQNQ